jgi:Peptidase family M28/Heavy metal binding domain
MKLTNVSKGTARVLLIAAFALLFCSTLLDITQSAATPPAEFQSAGDTTPTVTTQPALVERYQQTITPEALAARLYFLASDLFEGREATTRGQKLAAEYLASQYRQLGLAPKGNAKTTDPLSPSAYFQPFTVYKRTPRESRLEVLSGGSTVASSAFSAEAHDDLSYFLTGNAAASAAGGVVFAGYGIADDQLGYNDYAALKAKGISIDGKWVMILADEPLAADGTSLLPTADHKLSPWSALSLAAKRKALIEAGKPAGVLLVRYAGPRMQGTFADNAAQASLAAQRVGPLSLGQSTFPPTYAISVKLADQILAHGGRNIEDLRRQINQSLKPQVFEAGGVTVRTTVGQFEGLETENVLAFIEGSDPRLKDEVVVITAHYDHLGLNPTLKGDQIFNGAADDGTGTVATLELAQAFMRAKRDGRGPRRSVLFINFSAEEKGTLGSAHYALREPLVPLDRTVAEINMDGVGGFDPKHPAKSRNYVYIVGSGDLSREMIEANRRVKELTNINLDLTEGQNFPSDQLYFQAQLIPFIYYSTGLIEHYHQPGDEPSTIDYEHLARVTRLVFATAWQIANQDAKPRAVDRSQLKLDGYVCPPCGAGCDTVVYDHAGECPVCGMTLVPKYSGPTASARR